MSYDPLVWWAIITGKFIRCLFIGVWRAQNLLKLTGPIRKTAQVIFMQNPKATWTKLEKARQGREFVTRKLALTNSSSYRKHIHYHLNYNIEYYIISWIVLHRILYCSWFQFAANLFLKLNDLPSVLLALYVIMRILMKYCLVASPYKLNMVAALCIFYVCVY